MYFEDDQSCILQLDADIYEERFRVDRRKLEEMLLQVDNRTCCDRAEVFFQTIMDQTDTHISWPSRLKIGAKSKKDPHIKVMGTLAAVQSAKDSILDVLDTKCNRVTLKIDVSHTEHSHVIGKGGNNIKKVMQDTGCHIHFPDSNRNSQMEKSNQVSIAGAPAGAEKARSQIRELLPLVFMFDLPIRATSASVVPDSSSPHVQHIQQLYNVTVTFKPRPRMYVTQVLVRGTVVNANSVKEGTASVMKLYAGNMANSIPVSVTMEIAPQHHVFIMGRGGSSVQAIMQRTGASILFPDPSNVVPQRKGTVYITGHIDNVYLARGLLIGCLPLVLMFDIKDCQELDPRRLAEFMEQLDVFISIKPKPKQSNKSVIVKSTERNVANMYEARRLLLGLEPDSPTRLLLGLEPDTPTRLDTNSINIPSRMPPTGVDQNLISHPPWQYLPQSAGTSPLVLAGPVNPTLPRSFDVHERIINFTISDYNHNATQFTYAKGFGGHYDDSSADGSCYGDQASPSVSPSLASKTTVAMNGRSRTSNNSSATSGMSTDSLGSADFSMHSDADRANSRLTETKTSPSDSGSSSELSGLRMSPQTSSPIRNLPPPPGIVHPSASKQSLLLEENIKNAHVPFCNSDSGSRLRQCLQAELSLDKRAPGTDRPVCLLAGLHHLQLQQQIHNITNYDHDDEEQHHSPINYEEKKMLATLAMQKKPEGESRFPTDYWAGLGFSKSMPDSAIRQKLKAANARYLDSVHANSTISEANENGDMDTNPPNGGLSVTANGGLSVTAKPGYPAPGNYIRGAGLPSHADWSPSSSGSSGSCRSTQQSAPTNMAEHRKAPTHTTEQSSAPTNIDDHRRAPINVDDHRRAPTNKDQTTSATSNVAELFVELGLDKYTDKFLEQEIDLCTFLTLTDQDLRELGISKFGARRKMMLAIADLQKQCQQSVNTVAAPAILCDVGKVSSQLDASLSSKNNHLSPARHPFSHQTVFSRQHNDIMSQSGRW